IRLLMVQRLVETAVRRGRDDTQEQGHVVVRAKDVDTYSEISVEDGGAGADPEIMAKLMRGEVDGSHVGLRNVDLRLRQAYGTGHRRHIETAPHVAMNVSMRIPKFKPPARIVTPVMGRRT